VQIGRVQTGPGPAVPVPKDQLHLTGPALPSPSAAKAGWRGPTPPAAVSLELAEHGLAANRADPPVALTDRLRALGPAPAHVGDRTLAPATEQSERMAPTPLAQPSAASAATREKVPLRRVRPGQPQAPGQVHPGPIPHVPKVHPTIVRPARSPTPALHHALREKPGPIGSPSPVSAKASPHPARVPSLSRAASPGPATKPSLEAPEPNAPAHGPAERSANSCQRENIAQPSRIINGHLRRCRWPSYLPGLN